MSGKLSDWFTKKLYVTSPKDPDVFFHPRRYTRSKEEVGRAVHEAVAHLRGWTVQEYRENQGRVHVLRQGFLPLLMEDLNFYIVQGVDGTTKLEATSQSRGGRGDWGQNRRNLKKFLTRLDALIPPNAG
jgi:hypothetical protein